MTAWAIVVKAGNLPLLSEYLKQIELSICISPSSEETVTDQNVQLSILLFKRLLQLCI